MLKRAFTMLELVFVIVVVGILAASIIPRLERDNIGEAAHQVARHIRLAQHHALVYDTFGLAGSPAYGINFNLTNNTYTVSDGINAVVDPLTKKPLLNYDLGKNFGVTEMNATNITFDHMGRPTPNGDTMIEIGTGDANATITVYQETGFVKVTKIGSTVLP
jgi:prepilin-type N-terminal cleavage/methylation domain-containing protein